MVTSKAGRQAGRQVYLLGATVDVMAEGEEQKTEVYALNQVTTSDHVARVKEERTLGCLEKRCAYLGEEL